MAKDDSWETVETPQNKEDDVEYEIEGEEKEVETSAASEEDPQELEGIETKGAQKRIRQLVRQRKEREEQIDSLLQQNEKLKQVVNQKHSEVTEINKISLDASEKQLTDKIDLARAAYLEAFDEGDNKKVLNAQEMLTDAQSDLKAVSLAKHRFSQEAQAQPQPQPVAAQPRPATQVTSDPKAEDWASQNSWFGRDNVMTAAALAIDAELKGEGYDPNDQDFYKEINKRIKDTFPHKFEESEERVQETEAEVASTTSKPAQVVSGSSRSSSKSRSKVKLSQEDIRLAQKWNIPLEQYAAEKLKVTQADGEYTDIYR